MIPYRKYLFIGFFSLVWAFGAAPALGDEVVVDNLEYSKVGQFPKDWKTYPFHKNKTRRVYKVRENDGHKYIEAVDEKDISVPIFKDFHWDISKYPILKFRWRAKKLPEGAKEAHPDTNDSGCGVYVGFSRSSALKYVWSSGLTPGSFWAKNPGKFYIISKELGPEKAGTWQEVQVNIPQDYKKYFGGTLEKNPIGIGIMSDGNAVHKTAACDYRDFRITSIQASKQSSNQASNLGK